MGGGRPGVPPLRRKRGKPGRRAESSRPTKGGSGACPLIRPLRGHLPPRGKAFGGSTPQPSGLTASPLSPLTRETAAYGRVRIPAPTAEFFGGNGGRTMCAPTGEGAGTWPLIRPSVRTGAPVPYPLCPFGTSSLPLLAFGHFPLTGGIGPLTRGVGPQGEGSGKTKRDRSETCPLKHRGETQFRTKFLCLLSFSKKVRGLLGYFFSSGPLVPQPRGFLMAAWAAASRAMGTRKGEQDT